MLFKNKILKLPLRYIIYSPNDYCYTKLHEVSIFVEFMGRIYRKDGIDRNNVLDLNNLYRAINKGNCTFIHKFETFDSFIERVKKGNDPSERILGEIQTLNKIND